MLDVGCPASNGTAIHSRAGTTTTCNCAAPGQQPRPFACCAMAGVTNGPATVMLVASRNVEIVARARRWRCPNILKVTYSVPQSFAQYLCESIAIAILRLKTGMEANFS